MRTSRSDRIALPAIGIGLALGAVPLLSGAKFGSVQAAALLLGGVLLLLGLTLYAAGPPTWPAIPRTRSSKLVFALFVLGLGLRLAFVGHLGTADSGVDLGWGADVYAHGLPAAYAGNYFPIEWQIYAAVLAVHYSLGIKALVLFKLTNVVFDVAIYLVLRALLRRWSLNPDLALWYWLTPYFAALDWLGYVDFHLGLLGLLTVLLIVSRPTPRGYLVAGIPLGVMLLMKPQAVSLLLAIGVWVVVQFAVALRRGKRQMAPALMFVGPALFFGIYSVYFAANGFSLGHLFATYRAIPSFFPALDANMPNIWRIVAEAYRHGSEPIYSINDPHVFHPLSQVVGLTIIVGFIVQIGRRWASAPPGVSVLAVLAVAGAVSPMVLTQAHENHLFLGGLFLVALALFMRSRTFLLGTQALLFLVFINLFSLYGFDNTAYQSPLRTIYTDAAQVVLSAIAMVVFACGAVWLYRRTRAPIEPEAAAPVSAAARAAVATCSTSASVSSG